MPALNWLDYLLVFVLGFSAISAFRRGFSRVVIGLAASAMAIVLAMWFYGLAGSVFRAWVDSDRTANLIGFVAVLIAVWVVGGLIGWIVHRFLRTIGLSWFDRLLGMGFGLARGGLVAVALLTAYTAFGPHRDRNTMPDGVVHSRIAPYVLQASRLFVAVAPMDLKQSFQEHYLQAKSAWLKHTEENKSKREAGQ